MPPIDEADAAQTPHPRQPSRDRPAQERSLRRLWWSLPSSLHGLRSSSRPPEGRLGLAPLEHQEEAARGDPEVRGGMRELPPPSDIAEKARRRAGRAPTPPIPRSGPTRA